jgi:hypothetical protein
MNKIIGLLIKIDAHTIHNIETLMEYDFTDKTEVEIQVFGETRKFTFSEFIKLLGFDEMAYAIAKHELKQTEGTL